MHGISVRLIVISVIYPPTVALMTRAGQTPVLGPSSILKFSQRLDFRASLAFACAEGPKVGHLPELELVPCVELALGVSVVDATVGKIISDQPRSN